MIRSPKKGLSRRDFLGGTSAGLAAATIPQCFPAVGNQSAVLPKEEASAHSTPVPSRFQAQFLNKRHTYIRDEKITLKLQVLGADEVMFDLSGWFPERVSVQGGEGHYQVDTSLLRAGDYEVRAQLQRNGAHLGELIVFPMTIAPERNPQRFPVLHWGGLPAQELGWWADRGFNAAVVMDMNDPVDAAGYEARIRVLDEAARCGVDAHAYLYPLLSRRWEKDETVHCLPPSGASGPGETIDSQVVNAKAVYPRHPLVLEYARRTAEDLINLFGEYPSLRGVSMSSEYNTPFCVNSLVKKLAKEEAGIDLSAVLHHEWLTPPYAIDPAKLPPELQPKNGIIPDDHLIYRFLKWWWELGHGISVHNAEMAKVIKAKQPNVMTWHDPYREAPVYKSNVGLDCISTWTYGYPDIKRLCYTTVLRAAAKREQQKVMQTITFLTYASFVAPPGPDGANFGTYIPGEGAGFFFVKGPDYAREATWLVMSQRPDVLCYYYMPSADKPTVDPFADSPETTDAVGEVTRMLVEPFGPMILQCRRVKSNVAVLLSGSAVWFSNSRLWNGYPNEQILPYCGLLMMNHVPFEVLLDDDIIAGELRHYDTLVIPRGDTLTQSAHQRIVDFARSGKKVIATGSLRAHVPGAIITDFDFSFEYEVDGGALAAGKAVKADEYRTRMEDYAEHLKPLLTDITRPAESDSKRALINTLESGNIRYIFVVNDDRTYGPRFGQWKLDQDLGVRQVAKVRFATQGHPTLYDALERKPVTYTTRDGKAEFDVTLPPARGSLIAVLPESVARVEIVVSPKCERGKRCLITVRILGGSGEPFTGALPLRIDLIDPRERLNEYSRYAATDVNATHQLAWLPGLNDVSGVWRAEVTELLSGTKASFKFEIH